MNWKTTQTLNSKHSVCAHSQQALLLHGTPLLSSVSHTIPTCHPRASILIQPPLVSLLTQLPLETCSHPSPLYCSVLLLPIPGSLTACLPPLELHYDLTGFYLISLYIWLHISVPSRTEFLEAVSSNFFFEEHSSSSS